MFDVKFHVAYQRLIREGTAPVLLCPSCDGAQLFITVTGDDVDYECWVCDRTVILGLAALKSMEAYVEEDNARSRL